jgi:hypothetical protein
MATDKSSSEFVEAIHHPIMDGGSAQIQAGKDAEDVDVRELKDNEVTLATITVTHKPKLFSGGMLRLWGIVSDSPLTRLLRSKHSS